MNEERWDLLWLGRGVFDTLCDKFVSELWQVCGFLHQLNWLPRYNCNIVESGIKYHNPLTLGLDIHVVERWNTLLKKTSN